MAIAKVVTADLQSSVGNTYLQTRTTTAGAVAQKTLQGVPVLGAPTVRWVDVFTDFSGEIPIVSRLTTNGRLFVMTAITAGLARVMLYNFDNTTGAATAVGRLQLTFPNLAATAHIIKGLRIDDTNPSAMKIFIATTGSVTVHGGLYMANNVSTSDFAMFGFSTLPMATGSNQKAVYFLQDPAAIGNGQLNIAANSLAIDRTNKIVYVHNGVAATHQYYLYDYNNTPDVPTQTVTITIATPGVFTAASHGYNVGDQIVFSTTGALPTGVVAGTVYWVATANFTANTFSIAAALATIGTPLNTSGSQSGTHSVQRAYGISSSCWKWKTGNLPALSGVLLSTNSEKHVTPNHTANAGQPCMFFATTTNMYLGRASELTAATTSWASLNTVNLLGTANQIVSPVAALADWDETLDRAMITTSVSKIVAKKFVNNVIESTFGELNNDHLEGINQTDLITQFGAITMSDFGHADGWTFITGNATTGQRGVLMLNTTIQNSNDTSYVITKVMDTPNAMSYIGCACSLQASDKTAMPIVYYRTSGFGSATGGWTQLPGNLLMSSVTPAAQIQFKIQSKVDGLVSANPPQIIDFFLAYNSSMTMSDNWSGSHVNTSAPAASPFYVAFRLQKTYSTSVPRMRVVITDDTGAISSYDTVTHAANFSYSTNNGGSWNALGTVPNTALTTELRLLISAPSGNPITCVIQEY